MKAECVYLYKKINAENRPWIDIHGADLEEKELPTVEVIKNGPLKIMGKIKIIKEEGQLSIKEGETYFCRCGASLKKPYCDGTHREVDFKDS